MAKVVCRCGFTIEAETADQLDVVRDALEKHDCPRPPSPQPRWHESVFSWWGVLASIAVAYVVVAWINGGPW